MKITIPQSFAAIITLFIPSCLAGRDFWSHGKDGENRLHSGAGESWTFKKGTDMKVETTRSIDLKKKWFTGNVQLDFFGGSRWCPVLDEILLAAIASYIAIEHTRCSTRCSLLVALVDVQMLFKVNQIIDKNLIMLSAKKHACFSEKRTSSFSICFHYSTTHAPVLPYTIPHHVPNIQHITTTSYT